MEPDQNPQTPSSPSPSDNMLSSRENPVPAVVSPDFSQATPLPNTSQPPDTAPADINRPSPTSLPPEVTAVRKKKRNPAFITAIAVILVVGIAAAYYFGYYMNPGVIWGQALSNTDTGYNKLISYANTQSNAHYKGLKVSGNLKFTTNGATYQGTLSEQSLGSNSTTTLKLGLGVTNLSLNFITIQPTSSGTPDLYLKVSGFKNLGLPAVAGISPQALDSLDGQWIEISHTLLDSLKSEVLQTPAPTSPSLTWQDIYATAQKVGVVNSQYIFTTNSSKSVTKVVKDYGFVSIDGHDTYHYKVALVKQNVKTYIKALTASIAASPLGQYIAKESGQSVDSLLNDSSLESSANKINATDTFDVWVDTGTRLIYKVRVSGPSNPADNYVDIGLNYKKGSSYPFFINSVQGTGSQKLALSILSTLNTANNSVNSSVALSGSDIKAGGNFLYQPTNEPLHITAPSGAISLQQALSNLGLSALYNTYLTTLTSLAATQAQAL